MDGCIKLPLLSTCDVIQGASTVAPPSNTFDSANPYKARQITGLQQHPLCPCESQPPSQCKVHQHTHTHFNIRKTPFAFTTLHLLILPPFRAPRLDPLAMEPSSPMSYTIWNTELGCRPQSWLGQVSSEPLEVRRILVSFHPSSYFLKQRV